MNWQSISYSVFLGMFYEGPEIGDLYLGAQTMHLFRFSLVSRPSPL